MATRPSLIRRTFTQVNQPAVITKDAAAKPIFDATPRNS